MVSVVTKAVQLSVDDRKQDLELNELGGFADAVERLVELITESGHAVRLHCTVPTWAPSSETCLDLHDLHELRSKFLVFIHNLLESLRASGITASYRLAPSNSPLCLVYALPPELSSSNVQNAIATLQNTKNTRLSERESVLLADLEYGPALIIT